MTVRIRIVLLLLLLADPSLVPAQSSALPPRVSNRQDEAQSPVGQERLSLLELIEDLSSPIYSRRERATEILKSSDKALVTEIKTQYPNIDSHEVRLRLRDIAEHLFYREAIDNLGGFLGISLSAVGLQEDGQLQPNEVAIRIMEVLPGTSASEAGLQTGDLIMGIEGHNLNLTRGDPSEFVDLIGSMKPGSTVALKIQRHAQRFAAEVKLGKKMLHTLNRLRLRSQDREALDRAEHEFQLWWQDTAQTE